ncbi:asparagine synthase-related protein [Dyella nitratireducens]|uniref:asparagine synthase (glutamine-hydrolyzing) n=1 Tax=Dyella nitratireducens TaxID=1849580 RepID=A0ABQ1FMG8_9GAMM|nr:asparagine synthase-related protein [Dyella nitratireducens]GGA22766.1 hypothetical protein GCM10010981_08730 [Dyella nitratireducens]GLQ44067.1 hypothetical protein GCM10007902_39170 [Dyella nitratireducens]
MNMSPREWPYVASSLFKQTHIRASPYAGDVDFSVLDTADAAASASIDMVSLADLLRNSFVYPPHTIYRDVKIMTTGFATQQDREDELRFHFVYQSVLAAARPLSHTVSDETLLRTYHQLLSQAVQRSTASLKAPWFLQSGGKDSTSVAIAVADVRPDTTCLTYLGGREENEVASARFVARQLGLRHEALVCDPGRAYDRYLAMVPRMPLLTADFALLSYADLATEIGRQQGDGIIDGMGVDLFFGVPMHLRDHLIIGLARQAPIPGAWLTYPFIRQNFKLCFALASLQMNRFERHIPGSRFSDHEVNGLFGWNASTHSRKRMDVFQDDVRAARSAEGVRRIVLVMLEAGGFAKSMYSAKAMGLRMAYPYCDKPLCEWIFNEVPDDRLIGPGGLNKVLQRRYIAQRFQRLPYVQNKGSFRFNVPGLARQRFEQVHAFALQARAVLPGAATWLEEHRHCLGNKFFASKFYLLAVTLPWLLSRMRHAVSAGGDDAMSPVIS